MIREVLNKMMPANVRFRLRQLAMQGPDSRRKRTMDFGEIRQVTPINQDFGWSRGIPIDRYYIDAFLGEFRADIRGSVAEFQDDRYIRKFGGDLVTSRDVIDLRADHPGATVVADLASSLDLPKERFDCIICTQVLLFIYDVGAAVEALRRMLRPRGVLLVTVPGICRQVTLAAGEDADFWRFTVPSLRRTLGGAFGAANVAVRSYGNVLPAVAMLHGLAVEDLTRRELDHHDPRFEVTVAARAVKPENTLGDFSTC